MTPVRWSLLVIVRRRGRSSPPSRTRSRRRPRMFSRRTATAATGPEGNVEGGHELRRRPGPARRSQEGHPRQARPVAAVQAGRRRHDAAAGGEAAAAATRTRRHSGVDRRRRPAARDRPEARVRHPGARSTTGSWPTWRRSTAGPGGSSGTSRFTHLYNAGAGDDELQHLPQRPVEARQLALLAPEGPQPGARSTRTATIFRIDLRWYMWDATIWNRVLQDYPYGVLDDGVTAG